MKMLYRRMQLVSQHEQLSSRGYREVFRKKTYPLKHVISIADVFEALTASDRPYNTAKSLSQSIKTLSFMSKDRHIDSDLFKLFLSSGI